MQYQESTTKVNANAVARLVADGILNAWINPRTGKTRHYLNEDGLGKIIGLEQSYYKSGNVSGCHYIDAEGETVSVAHSRAFNGTFSKVYVEDGAVHSSWNPYGENIAELVAARINELCPTSESEIN